MRKLLALLLTLTMLLTLTACGGEQNPQGDHTALSGGQNTSDPDPVVDEPAETTTPNGESGESDGSMVMKDSYGSYSRNTECASVTMEFVYSNGEPVEFQEVWEVPAAEWGFSTTDTRYTLTIVTVYANNNTITVDYSGITEEAFTWGDDITDLTYEPVAGKEIQTLTGEILEGFTYRK